MWHEARRREKATQKLLNEHKKRAEKRREENRVDPNSLLQINGLKAKLCLDPSVYKQAVKSLVAWQGDKSITIDRFDVRATLSTIPNETTTSSQDSISHKSNNNIKQESVEMRNLTVLDAGESEPLKRLLNYERYRLLIQNDLNKVPEELRLKLVSQSDVSSDAKFRKLSYNKFGTSGDASIASGSSYITASSTGRITGQSGELIRRPGAAIGFNYNSMPSAKNLITDISTDSKYSHDDTSLNQAQAIMDLDEFDNFDLDGVNINLEHFETKRINEIARKYGLTSDEFLVLIAKWDGSDIGIVGVLKELKKLNKRNSANKEETINQGSSTDKRVYGPDLPPELMAHSDTQSPSLSSSSSQGSPVQQRSPSGAHIPRRNGHRDNDVELIDRKLSPNTTNGNLTNIKIGHESPMSPRESLAPNQLIRDSCGASSSMATNRKAEVQQMDQSSSYNVVLPNNVVSESIDSRVSPHHSARRASTPLAYKRNRRSSRSLSLERRSSRHRNSSTSRASRRSPRSRSRSCTSSSQESTASDYSSKASRKQTSRRHTSRHRKSTRRR